ncbi:heterodisulfide reductase-related iron-sulfur binding cluster, partial [Escherichia coli]
YDSQWAAICSIAPKIGCTPETLRVWVRQHERDTCCGFGGTFSVKMAEISGEMVKEKVLHLMDAKPEFLIGADVSCLLNIGGRLQREGQPVKVMHIAEVLMSR